jgi:hypothetical protein
MVEVLAPLAPGTAGASLAGDKEPLMFSVTSLLLGMMLTSMWIVASCTARAGCTVMKINKPGLTGAMMLTLVAVAGAIASQFAIGTLMGMSLMGMAAEPSTADQMRLMLAMPVWMIVCAMVYRMMLPTTFGKAMCLFAMQAVVVGAMALGMSMLAQSTQQRHLMELRQMMPM